MKPTPGPWRALGGAIRPASAKGYTGGYAPILIAKHDKRLPDNREANAKLAAAAPELLEMLIKCVDAVEYHHEQTHCDGDFDLKAAVHALIRKAGGAL